MKFRRILVMSLIAVNAVACTRNIPDKLTGTYVCWPPEAERDMASGSEYQFSGQKVDLKFPGIGGAIEKKGLFFLKNSNLEFLWTSGSMPGENGMRARFDPNFQTERFRLSVSVDGSLIFQQDKNSLAPVGKQAEYLRTEICIQSS